MKYRKKPGVIDAIVWTGKNRKEIKEFMNRKGSFHWGRNYMGEELLIIHTLEGNHSAGIGDFIVRGVAGEFYPVKSEIFNETYKEATDEN